MLPNLIYNSFTLSFSLSLSLSLFIPCFPCLSKSLRKDFLGKVNFADFKRAI